MPATAHCAHLCRCGSQNRSCPGGGQGQGIDPAECGYGQFGLSGQVSQPTCTAPKTKGALPRGDSERPILALTIRDGSRLLSSPAGHYLHPTEGIDSDTKSKPRCPRSVYL